VTQLPQPVKSTPLISIITVVLNNVNQLETAIQSVINQSYQEIEHIIIDGGSTDGTISIIEKYQHRLKYWISKSDRGIYDAMNHGLEHAAGELVLFLNSDDRLADDILATVINSVNSHPDYDIYHGSIIIDRQTYVAHGKLPTSIPAYQPASFVRRSLLNGQEWFDITYKIASDFKFFKSLQISGHKFLKLDYVISQFSTGGISANLEVRLNEMSKILIELGYARLLVRLLVWRMFLIEKNRPTNPIMS
jgi:glycosyltransferase involved in cell wall biosynthesis